MHGGEAKLPEESGRLTLADCTRTPSSPHWTSRRRPGRRRSTVGHATPSPWPCRRAASSSRMTTCWIRGSSPGSGRPRGRRRGLTRRGEILGPFAESRGARRPSPRRGPCSTNLGGSADAAEPHTAPSTPAPPCRSKRPPLGSAARTPEEDVTAYALLARSWRRGRRRARGAPTVHELLAARPHSLPGLRRILAVHACTARGCQVALHHAPAGPVGRVRLGLGRRGRRGYRRPGHPRHTRGPEQQGRRRAEHRQRPLHHPHLRLQRDLLLSRSNQGDTDACPRPVASPPW